MDVAARTLWGMSSAELYNGTAWVDAGIMSLPRSNHTATLLNNGNVLVVGGNGALMTELFDPVNGTWTPAGSTTMPHSEHTATRLPDNRVLIVGGFDGTSSNAWVEVYTP